MGLLGVLVTLLAAGVLYQRVGLTRQRREFAPPGQMIGVGGGHRLHATCRGSGEPLVIFESGIAASSLSWSLVAPEVAAFTRTCAYDRAGLGWSEAPTGPRSFERIVDDLCALIDRVGPQGSGDGRDANGVRDPGGARKPDHPGSARGRYVLVGHSFGSFVVRAFAMRRPDQVAGLVLVDPATEWLTTTAQRARLLRGGQQLSRVGAWLAHAGVVRACLALLTGGAPAAPRTFVKIFGPTAAQTLERLVGEVRKLPPELYPAVRAMWCQPKCFHAMRDHMSVLEREGQILTTLMPRRDIPVIVLSGGNQPEEQLAAHRLMAQASDRGRHVIASRSAHWIQFDEPGLIVDAIRDIVTRQRVQ